MALHTKAARRLAAFALLAASLAGCAQEDFGMLYDERLGGDTTAFSAGRRRSIHRPGWIRHRHDLPASANFRARRN